MTRALILAALCLWSASAAAQVIVNTTSPTVTTTSGNCLQANALRSSLALDNTGGTVDVGYCLMASVPPGQLGTPCTAVIGAAGTSTVAAGKNAYWGAGDAPTNGMCFIAASSTQVINIREGQ